MQFMPGTWASMGVDGDGDGSADIHKYADSIHSAVNYLTKSGVITGRATFCPRSRRQPRTGTATFGAE